MKWQSLDWLQVVRALARMAMMTTFAAAVVIGQGAQAQAPATIPAPPPAAADAVPDFAAATIKLMKDANPNRKTDREEGRRFTAQGYTLAEMLMMAYRLDRRQIVGGPAWVTTDQYDLVAVAENDTDMKENGRVMFQKLLTDRFELTFHREQREIPVYVMTLAKGGSKLTPADANGTHQSGCQRLGQCTFRRGTHSTSPTGCSSRCWTSRWWTRRASPASSTSR